MNSKVYLRKLSYNYFLLLLLLLFTFKPPFTRSYFLFVSSEQGIHRTTSPTSLRLWICQNTLTTVFNISRITLTVFTFRVIVTEVLLKVTPQILRRQWWQKWNLSISYGGTFWRNFILFITLHGALAKKKERKKKARVIRDGKKNSTFGYFEPTPSLERGSTYGLLHHDYDSCIPACIK